MPSKCRPPDGLILRLRRCGRGCLGRGVGLCDRRQPASCRSRRVRRRLVAGLPSRRPSGPLQFDPLNLGPRRVDGGVAGGCRVVSCSRRTIAARHATDLFRLWRSSGRPLGADRCCGQLQLAGRGCCGDRACVGRADHPDRLELDELLRSTVAASFAHDDVEAGIGNLQRTLS